ncbi:MAG TPA: LysR family transcriptional regulator [Rhodobacteraceae bacterium]|nr:LysR family transcriptional regulator [Paracoccaceae bacterium]
MAKLQSQAILFELLRSFTSLAKTLNLSKTVRELGSTRQTVRRHINLLEEHKGEPLFRLEDRQYQLTEAGKRALPEALRLLSRGQAWLNNQSDHINGLTHLTFDENTPLPYYLQQHPLGRLWKDSSELMQYGFQCWARAKGEIENEVFENIRPYLMIYRRYEKEWICIEIGDQSSYASWYGWGRARSSIGRDITDLPRGAGFANLLAQTFEEVAANEGVRLDHIHTQHMNPEKDMLVPISYQRLLMGCRFPDGSFALAALIDRTHDIEIAGLSKKQIRSMPKELVMNIDTKLLKTLP